MEEESAPSPGLSADQEEASSTSLDAVDKDTTCSPPSKDGAASVGEENDNVPDHISKPATPASDVSEKTGEFSYM